MYPGLMGEERVGTPGPPPESIMGGTVTLTDTTDMVITMHRGPCIWPRPQLCTYRRPGLYTPPYQGLCMVEVT
jgi:hypothetical protein